MRHEEEKLGAEVLHVTLRKVLHVSDCNGGKR
jgi:hypothetical protein